MSDETVQENALALTEQPAHVVVHTMSDIERAAKAMAASGFFADSKGIAQAVVKILAGRELGFGPFASMTGVHIIKGKPVLAANLMAAAVKRTGKYNYRVKRLDDDGCELEFYEGGGVVGTSSFTKADAEKAELLGKDVWIHYPRNMYFARALSNGQKWYAPDVFNGATVYTPEELGGEVDEDGNYLPSEDEIEEGEYAQEPEDILVPFKKAKSLFGGNVPTLAELYERDSGYVEWIAANVDDSAIKDAAAKLIAERQSQKPQVDMSALIQVAPFMQTHEERQEAKIAMTDYWQSIKAALGAAGIEGDAIKDLVRGFEMPFDLKEWVTGWFRLLEQFAYFVKGSPDKLEYAKSVVRQGIAAQQDWFGAVESLNDPLMAAAAQLEDVVIVEGEADSIPDL